MGHERDPIILNFGPRRETRVNRTPASKFPRTGTPTDHYTSPISSRGHAEHRAPKNIPLSEKFIRMRIKIPPTIYSAAQFANDKNQRWYTHHFENAIADRVCAYPRFTIRRDYSTQFSGSMRTNENAASRYERTSDRKCRKARLRRANPKRLA